MSLRPEQQTASGPRWTDANLETQGYDLAELARRRGRAIGLRFSTSLCLALVITALVLQSVPLLLVMSVIGAIAGFSPRHPFDLIWNHALRHPLEADAIPPNPARRRHSFKVATAWLLVVAVLFASGDTVAALVLGAILVAVCMLVTTTNLCLISVMMNGLDRVRSPRPRPGESN